MNVPFTAVYFATYESAKKAIGHREGEDEGLLVQVRNQHACQLWSRNWPVLASHTADPALSCCDSQVAAGGLAGAAAAAATNPLDVVKTRLQLDGVHSPRSSSTGAIVRPVALLQALLCALKCLMQRLPAQGPALRQILLKDGQRGLWVGVKARMLFHIPAAAISWGTYESCKKLFSASAAATAGVAV